MGSANPRTTSKMMTQMTMVMNLLFLMAPYLCPPPLLEAAGLSAGFGSASL